MLNKGKEMDENLTLCHLILIFLNICHHSFKLDLYHNNGHLLRLTSSITVAIMQNPAQEIRSHSYSTERFQALFALERLTIPALQPLIKYETQYQTYLLIFLQRCHSKDFLSANLQNVNKYLWHEATRAEDVYEAMPHCLSSEGKSF